MTLPKVKWVAYPGLPSHPSHECAKAMLRKGMFGGVLTFAPHGGAETANAVIENLKLATHLANLGEFIQHLGLEWQFDPVYLCT